MTDQGFQEDGVREVPADPIGDSGAAALAHLQAAVLEMVAASRAALDVVEKLVKDPEALAPLVDTASGLGHVLADMVKARARSAEGRGEPSPGGVQHIRIS
ncbi:MAG: hypothetical protein ACYCZV_15095 [Acidimicrobiales bacterium]